MKTLIKYRLAIILKKPLFDKKLTRYQLYLNIISQNVMLDGLILQNPIDERINSQIWFNPYPNDFMEISYCYGMFIEYSKSPSENQIETFKKCCNNFLGNNEKQFKLIEIKTSYKETTI